MGANIRLSGPAVNAYFWKPQDLAKFSRLRRLVDTRRAAGFEKSFATALDKMADWYLTEYGPKGVALAKGQVADLEGEVDRLVKLANAQDAPRGRGNRGTVDAKPTKSKPDNEVDRLVELANDIPPTTG